MHGPDVCKHRFLGHLWWQLFGFVPGACDESDLCGWRGRQLTRGRAGCRAVVPFDRLPQPEGLRDLGIEGWCRARDRGKVAS